MERATGARTFPNLGSDVRTEGQPKRRRLSLKSVRSSLAPFAQPGVETESACTAGKQKEDAAKDGHVFVEI
jgi:hypothetical protein